jgi:hypothetical protein
MNKAALFAIICAVALAGYVAAGPFLTAHRIGDALRERDSEALADNVDFPTLRQNLKDQISALMLPEVRQNAGAAAEILVVSGIIDRFLDSIITPSGIAALALSAGSSQNGASAAAKSQGLQVTRYSYDGLSRFSAYVKSDHGGDLRFVFSRHGISWKLSNIVVPNGQFGVNAPNHVKSVRPRRAPPMSDSRRSESQSNSPLGISAPSLSLPAAEDQLGPSQAATPN